MLKFHVTTASTAAAVANLPCCDSAHAGDRFARQTCSHPKSMYLYPDGSFALVHRQPVLAPGYIIQPACAESLVLLEAQKKQAQAAKERAEKAMRPGKTGPSDMKAVAEGSTGMGTATENQKHTPSHPSPPTEAHLKRGSTACAKTHLEQQARASISTAAKASQATAYHGIFQPPPKSAEDDAFAVPGSFPFEIAAAKGNKLGKALQEAADSCAAAKARDEATTKEAADMITASKKLMEKKATEKKMAEEKEQRQSAEEEDWEMVDSAALDEDYVVVRRFG